MGQAAEVVPPMLSAYLLIHLLRLSLLSGLYLGKRVADLFQFTNLSPAASNLTIILSSVFSPLIFAFSSMVVSFGPVYTFKVPTQFLNIRNAVAIPLNSVSANSMSSGSRSVDWSFSSRAVFSCRFVRLIVFDRIPDLQNSAGCLVIPTGILALL